MKPILLIVICKDNSQAKLIGSHLLRNRLVACYNIISPIRSHFLWHGKPTLETESLLLGKTFDTKWEQIQEEVAKLHSYQIPDVMSLPIYTISAKYVDWMKREMKI